MVLHADLYISKLQLILLIHLKQISPKNFLKKKMKFLLDSGWESPAIYRTIPGEASLSEEEDDPLESTSCFLYCLLFCTPALSGESSDPLLLSPSYNTFNIYTFCILTGDVIFKKGVKLSFIYIKQ